MSAPSPSEAAVSIRNLSRNFQGVIALDRVNLDVRAGEFFSLLGPSGCGKTTLLRIIGGFEVATSGDLAIKGRDVLDVPPFRRRTNMVFQHGALFPHLTVAENVAFGLQMKRLPKPVITRRVAEILDLVRLGDYGQRRVDQLSGGQRQRIALARALVNEPEVLLLDEPLSALDLQLRLQMQDELRRLQRETRGTFIFVTHDQGEAITMSDRLAVMAGGRILQIGTPRDVYERPTHRFVAEFIGHSNLLEGHVTAMEGREAVVLSGPLEVKGLMNGPADIGRQVVAAIRYERVELVPCRGAGEPWTGTVLDEIYMGATVRRRIALSSGVSFVAESSPFAGGQDLPVGSSVRMNWPSDAVMVLSDG